MNYMNPEDENTQSFEIISSGTIIEHYRIINIIGFGGMGEVYLAEDTRLNRKVAIKFLASHFSSIADYKTRFIREAQAAAALNHPHIIHIHEVSEYNNRPFIVMEMIDGFSLRELKQKDQLSIEELIKLFIRICDGLRHAHNEGIIHRDIKSANILVDSENRPRILDFGLAIIEGSDKITKSGTTMGTIAYMSPEQTSGVKIDNRSDIFSLGIILYEMLTLQHPFKKENIPATIKAIQDHSPDPLARFKNGLPESLQIIVNKALDKNLETRYQNIEDMQVDLKRILIEMGIESDSYQSIRMKKTYTKHIITIISLSFIILIISSLIINPILRQKVRVWAGIDEPVPKAKHLVVIPFTNLGEFKKNRTFCDGLMEIFTSKLTQLEQFQGSLWVIPASEVRKREISSAKDARKIFGANLAVTGSVQRYDENIRVTLNLVDTQTERQIRSSVMDYSLINVVALQDSTVLCLARMLEVELLPEHEELIFAGGTVVPDAYEFYINGLGHLKKYHVLPDLPSVDTAIFLFSKATEADSNYALAFAGLGEAYWKKYQITREPKWIDNAKTHCKHALELDDQLAQVKIVLGTIYRGVGEYEKAVENFKAALDYDPLNYNATRGLAITYLRLKEFEIAEDLFKKAIEIKPNYWQGYISLGKFYRNIGQPDHAVDALKNVSDLLPEDFQALNDLGGLYYSLDRIEEAQSYWEKSISLLPNYAAYSNLGSLFYMEKLFVKAANMYEEALNLDDIDYQVWGNLASTYGWLNKSIKEKDMYQKAIKLAKIRESVNPNNPEIISDLALYYAALKEIDSALVNTEQALKLGKDNINIIFRIGLVYEELNNRDSAFILITDALLRGYPMNEVNLLPDLEEFRKSDKFVEFINNHKLESVN